MAGAATNSLEDAIRMLHTRIGRMLWDAWAILAELNREAERVLAAVDVKRQAREAIETKVRVAIDAGHEVPARERESLIQRVVDALRRNGRLCDRCTQW